MSIADDTRPIDSSHPDHSIIDAALQNMQSDVIIIIMLIIISGLGVEYQVT